MDRENRFGHLRVLHTVVGLVAFRWRLAELVCEDLANTVDGRPGRGFPFWFIVCGILWMIFGALLNWVERMGLVFPLENPASF